MSWLTSPSRYRATCSHPFRELAGPAGITDYVIKAVERMLKNHELARISMSSRLKQDACPKV